MELQTLPKEVEALIDQLKPPPRLVAHLTLVHDTAFQLTYLLEHQWPGLQWDREAILFGAGVHDLGKVMVPNELSGPGHAHELKGEQLLIGLGVSPAKARFCRTHGTWRTEKTMNLADLVVALADTCWKGERNEELETRLMELMNKSLNQPSWEIYCRLDEILTEITAEGAQRLAWQKQLG